MRIVGISRFVILPIQFFLYAHNKISIYPFPTFLISIQVSHADDSRRDSDGCYYVWSVPAWLMNWLVNENDSTEFYVVFTTKKTTIRFGEFGMETMRLSRCRLWKMKNWRLNRLIQNCFSTIENITIPCRNKNFSLPNIDIWFILYMP